MGLKQDPNIASARRLCAPVYEEIIGAQKGKEFEI